MCITLGADDPPSPTASVLWFQVALTGVRFTGSDIQEVPPEPQEVAKCHSICQPWGRRGGRAGTATRRQWTHRGLGSCRCCVGGSSAAVGAAGGGGQLCSLGLWGRRPGQHEGSTWADHLALPGSEKACELQRPLRTRGGTTSKAEASVLTDKRETTKMPLGG